MKGGRGGGGNTDRRGAAPSLKIPELGNDSAAGTDSYTLSSHLNPRTRDSRIRYRHTPPSGGASGMPAHTPDSRRDTLPRPRPPAVHLLPTLAHSPTPPPGPLLPHSYPPHPIHADTPRSSSLPSTLPPTSSTHTHFRAPASRPSPRTHSALSPTHSSPPHARTSPPAHTRNILTHPVPPPSSPALLLHASRPRSPARPGPAGPPSGDVSRACANGCGASRPPFPEARGPARGPPGSRALTLASWGLGIDVRRRRERGGASLLSHLGGGGGGGSGGGGDDSPPASARDTRPGPAAAARVHESVLLLLLRPPLRLLLPPLPPLPPLPCGVAWCRARPPLPLQPLPDGRRLQPHDRASATTAARAAGTSSRRRPSGGAAGRGARPSARPPHPLTGWPAGAGRLGPPPAQPGANPLPSAPRPLLLGLRSALLRWLRKRVHVTRAGAGGGAGSPPPTPAHPPARTWAGRGPKAAV